MECEWPLEAEMIDTQQEARKWGLTPTVTNAEFC